MRLGKLSFGFHKPRRAGIHIGLSKTGGSPLPIGLHFAVHGPGGRKVKGLSATVKMPGSKSR